MLQSALISTIGNVLLRAGLQAFGLQTFEETIGTKTLHTIKKLVLAQGDAIGTLIDVVATSCEVIKLVVLKLREHMSENLTEKFSKKRKENLTEKDRTLLVHFLEYTFNILGLCTDVKKFLRVARDRHSEIEHMASLWTNNNIDEVKPEDFKKISEDLKNMKDSEASELSCKNLLRRVEHFRCQQENVVFNLIQPVESEEQVQSEEETTNTCGWWRRALRRMITIGCYVGNLVLSCITWPVRAIQKMANAVFKAEEMAKEGDSPCISLVKAFPEEDVFSTQTETSSSKKKTQTETHTKERIIVVSELQEIDLLINNVAGEIDSILDNVNYAINRGNVGLAMKNMSVKAEKFLKIIEESEGKLEQCVSKITEAREEVMSALTPKKKSSCSIL